MPLTVLWQKPARARPVVRALDGAQVAEGARAFVDVGVARQVALGVPRVALDMAALVVPVRRPVIRQLAPVAGFELAGVRAVPGTQVGVPRSVAAPLLVDGSLFDGRCAAKRRCERLTAIRLTPATTAATAAADFAAGLFADELENDQIRSVTKSVPAGPDDSRAAAVTVRVPRSDLGHDVLHETRRLLDFAVAVEGDVVLVRQFKVLVLLAGVGHVRIRDPGVDLAIVQLGFDLAPGVEGPLLGKGDDLLNNPDVGRLFLGG